MIHRVYPPPSPLRGGDTKWVEILNDARDEFQVDGATAAFSTWKVVGEDPLDIEIADSRLVRAGRLVLSARIADDRAIQRLAVLPEGEFILTLKFRRNREDG